MFLPDKLEEKIGDFGLATKLEFEGDRKRTVCGTPNYIAPEILDGKQGHSYEVDIWSLGVILFTLLIGKPPFETSDVKTTYRRIKMNAYSFPDHVTISEQAKSLITKILNLDPSKRPSLDEISDHPFFHTGSSIPKLLPASTLACPPSASYVKQFMPNSLPSNEKLRLESTTPIQPGDIKSATAKTVPNAFNNTEKLNLKSEKEEAHPDAQGEEKKAKKPSDKPLSQPGAPAVCIKKWVDYSSKYGLGYMLTNGATGVFFNDSTKIILDSKGQYAFNNNIILK